MVLPFLGTCSYRFIILMHRVKAYLCQQVDTFWFTVFVRTYQSEGAVHNLKHFVYHTSCGLALHILLLPDHQIILPCYQHHCHCTYPTASHGTSLHPITYVYTNLLIPFSLGACHVLHYIACLTSSIIAIRVGCALYIQPLIHDVSHAKPFSSDLCGDTMRTTFCAMIF